MSRLEDHLQLSEMLRARCASFPQEYHDRLEEELTWIRIYSLSGEILADVKSGVKCKDNPNGLVFPFLAGITTVDPVISGIKHKYDKGAMDAPDIDSDITPEHREQVEKHLHELYGEDNVAHVATYLEWGAKSVIKDICRLWGVPYLESNQITALAQDEPDATVTEEWDYICQNCPPNLQQHVRSIDPVVRAWGEKWRGLFRSVGKHAAGIVITPDPIGDCVPVLRQKGVVMCAIREGQETRELTELGYLKADLLGLSTCTIIEQAMKNIAAAGKTLPFKSIDHIPLDDQKVLEKFSRGDTSCIFQFTESGMQKLITDMKADTFNDLVAASAIYRPGPLRAGIDKAYVRGKRHPDGIGYAHPSMKQALDKTFGTMIYQEQQMQILQLLGGFTMAEADQARKTFKLLANMKPAEARQNAKLKKLLSKLESGCQKLGIAQEQVDALLAMFGEFSKYSFNLSHSCLTGDSLVSMADGSLKRIDQVSVGDRCVALDLATKRFFVDEVVCVHNNGRKRVRKYQFGLGKSINGTGDHKILGSDFVMKKVERFCHGGRAVVYGGDLMSGPGSAEFVGESKDWEEDVYDLTMRSENHNYIANGIVVSNCSYSFISYQLQYLRTYFPTEFYCALFNVTKASFDPWTYRAMAKRDGVDIEMPRLGVSGTQFRVLGEGKIIWGLYLIRGLSEEIPGALYDIPPGDWLVFFMYLFHVGYNKRQCEGIIKCGATDHIFPNRRQVWESYVYWNEQIRPKWKKNRNFDLKSLDDMRNLFAHVSDWSAKEKAGFSEHFLGGCDATIQNKGEIEEFCSKNQHLHLIPAGLDVAKLNEWFISEGLNFVGKVKSLAVRKIGKGEKKWDQLVVTIASEFGQATGTITNWDWGGDNIGEVRKWCAEGDVVAIRFQKNDKNFVNIPALNQHPNPLIKNFSREQA